MLITLHDWIEILKKKNRKINIKLYNILLFILYLCIYTKCKQLRISSYYRSKVNDRHILYTEAVSCDNGVASYCIRPPVVLRRATIAPISLRWRPLYNKRLLQPRLILRSFDWNASGKVVRSKSQYILLIDMLHTKT